MLTLSMLGERPGLDWSRGGGGGVVVVVVEEVEVASLTAYVSLARREIAVH